MSTEVKDDLLGSLDERIRRISKEVLVEHQAREQQSGNSSIADSEDEKLGPTRLRKTPKLSELVSPSTTTSITSRMPVNAERLRQIEGKRGTGSSRFFP